MYSSSSEAGLSRVRRRVIRRYFHGIGFPHRFVFVLTVYQIPMTNGEELMNRLVIFYLALCKTYKTAAANCSSRTGYAGYRLVISSITGIARENRLMSQGYKVFLEKNIRPRQPAVMNSGNVTAV